MNSIEAIRREIERLFRTSPDVHINVTIKRPRVSLRDEPVLITGVYPHIFKIEEWHDGYPRSRTLQYADVLTGQIEIRELGGNV